MGHGRDADVIAGLLLLTLQVADPALFTPPLDRTFVVEMEQARSVARMRGVYRSTRTVRFHRDHDGLVAVLVVGPADRAATGPGADLFQRAMSALAGQTMRFRLDARGTVVRLDELDAHWQRLIDTVARLSPDADGERFAAPLRGFPPAAQLRFLATMLDPILPDPAGHPPGERPVKVAARAPAGTAMQLEGRERVARRGDGTVQVSVDATGDDGQATVTLAGRDVFDATTGLRLSHEERRRTTLIGDGEREALIVEERWTITPR